MTEVEKIVSKANRARLVFGAAIGGLLLLTLVALGGSIVANVVNVRQDTKLERFSACEGDPSGNLCQQIKRESDEAQSIKDTCRSFWKVGYACPKPGSKAAERQARAVAVASPPVFTIGSPPATDQGAANLDASQPDHHGASPQKPGGSGPTPAPIASNPPAGVPASTQPAQDPGPGTESEPPADPAATNPIREGVGSLLEDTGQTVNEAAGGTVKTVEGVGHAANCALLPSC